MSNQRQTELLEESLGNKGSVAIATTEVTANMTAIQFVSDSVVSAQTDANGCTNADLTSFTTISAGTIVYGRWAAITLTSGSAIGYLE